MSPQQDPSLRTGETSQPEFDMGNVIDELIEQRRGGVSSEVVVDRAVGAIVALGGVQGTHGVYSSEYLLNLLSMVAQGRVEVSVIPRAYGLRKTAAILAGDEGTVDYLVNAPERVRRGADEAFASLDVIRGYLETKTALYKVDSTHPPLGSEWVDTIVGEIDSFARSEHARDHWAAGTSMQGSDSPYLREQGGKIARALQAAREVGADTNMLSRTADFLRGRVAAGRTIGGAAITGTTENFDYLFSKEY